MFDFITPTMDKKQLKPPRHCVTPLLVAGGVAAKQTGWSA